MNPTDRRRVSMFRMIALYNLSNWRTARCTSPLPSSYGSGGVLQYSMPVALDTIRVMVYNNVEVKLREGRSAVATLSYR